MANSLLGEPQAATEPVYTQLAVLTKGEQQEQERDVQWIGDVNEELCYSKSPASSSPWQQNSEFAFTCRTQNSGPQPHTHRQVIGHCEDTEIGPSESPSRPTEQCRPGLELLDSEEEEETSQRFIKRQRCSFSPVTHRDFNPAPSRRPSCWGDSSRLTFRCEPFPFPTVARASLAHSASRQPSLLSSFPIKPLRKENVPNLPASTSTLPGDNVPPALDSGMKVMGLYADLVKELQEQVMELQRREQAQAEVVMLRERRIKALERENQRLKDQLQKLEEENDLLSSDSERGITMRGLPAGALDASKKSLKFLRDLVEQLESNMGTQNPLCDDAFPAVSLGLLTEETFAPVKPYREINDNISGTTTWDRVEERFTSPVGHQEIRTLDNAMKDTLPDGSPVWACAFEVNGRPKSELIPGSGVYLTNRELDELSHLPRDKPKLMTRKLLGYFFSDQTLARSSARGKRIAHNKTTMEKPICLPSTVTSAIKDYVTSVCGRGCDFTAVINSKCSSSRRTVRKLTGKME
ncbi:uncharacterized protein LOC119953911 [Scyliorhinus canicula]|uniref:uncharacterized protein LOC119953911 n=1 Tax=Scyliorhinus canicula TaxID=7830 RepID=UPI0018F5E7BF|nr:uncharacterized protein LOC119953911 [Scyliorhinus canicula]XP_038634508.1 uncharacterized protein LOC119953911 [Scyliorhinus canicula]